MKKYLFLILGLSACMSSWPQSSRPFVAEGKSWNYKYVKYGWDNDSHTSYVDYTEYSSYRIEGGTLVGDNTWKKVYRIATRDGVESRELSGAMRETDGKVYFLEGNSDQEGLQYDFSMQTGDEANLTTRYGTDGWLMGMRQSVVLGSGETLTGYVYELLRKDPQHPREAYVAIEGLGGYDGFSLLPFIGIETNTFDNTTEYLSCTLDGDVLATGQEIHELCEQVATAYGRLDSLSPALSPQDNGRKTAYDMQGRRLELAPGRGIYIRDGRKTVRR